MVEEDPDDTPEYYLAKQEWIQFWKHVERVLKGVLITIQSWLLHVSSNSLTFSQLRGLSNST
jgi:hypothetical protein